MFWWRHVFYIRAARGEANWMWMEGDGVDGGGNLLNATPSSLFFFRGPLFSLDNSQSVCGTCHGDVFSWVSPSAKSPNNFILIFLIAVFLDIYFWLVTTKCSDMKCITTQALGKPLLSGGSAAQTVGTIEEDSLTLAVFR